MYCVYRLQAWFTLVASVGSFFQGQTTRNSAPPIILEISGPQVVHRGANLWFAATLTNRSEATVAVPSLSSNIVWWYMVEAGWSITDKKGKLLKSTQADVVRFDNMIQMPTFKDTDFVLLKPGDKIEYHHENLGDPSDLFFFPGNGTFEVSLAWHFCAPTVTKMPDGSITYKCGVTQALSQPIRAALLSTPSFDVRSNIWRIELK